MISSAIFYIPSRAKSSFAFILIFYYVLFSLLGIFIDSVPYRVLGLAIYIGVFTTWSEWKFGVKVLVLMVIAYPQMRLVEMDD
jgi:hypothetical protein